MLFQFQVVEALEKLGHSFLKVVFHTGPHCTQSYEESFIANSFKSSREPVRSVNKQA